VARAIYLQRFKKHWWGLDHALPMCDTGWWIAIAQAGFEAIATAQSVPAIVYLGPLYMVLHSLASHYFIPVYLVAG